MSRSFVVTRSPGGLGDHLAASYVARPEQHLVYDPTREVVVDPVIARIRLNDVQRDWRDLKVRYGHLSEFWKMVRRDICGS